MFRGNGVTPISKAILWFELRANLGGQRSHRPQSSPDLFTLKSTSACGQDVSSFKTILARRLSRPVTMSPSSDHRGLCSEVKMTATVDAKTAGPQHSSALVLCVAAAICLGRTHAVHAAQLQAELLLAQAQHARSH